MSDLFDWLRSQWDRVTGWCLVALGLVLLLLGIKGTVGARYLVDQLSYLMSGGIGGLGCIALGAALIVSSDVRDEWTFLRRVENAIRSTDAVLPADGQSRPGIAGRDHSKPAGMRG